MSAAKENGNIINPEIEIYTMSPERILSGLIKSNPKKPVNIPPNPVTQKAGILDLNLSKTKFNPRAAAVKIPHVVPKKMFSLGEFITFFASKTTINIPIIANLDAKIVDLFIFSFNIILEKKEANRGLVAIANKINATDELYIPIVKKIDPAACVKIINIPSLEKIKLNLFLYFSIIKVRKIKITPI